jgi:hypothetical protein
MNELTKAVVELEHESVSEMVKNELDAVVPLKNFKGRG